MIRSATTFLTLAFIAIFLSTSPSRAATVVVDGFIYDIAFTDRSTSFNDNSALLTSTDTAPWWGDFRLAREFIESYQSQVGRTSETQAFAYEYIAGSSPQRVSTFIRFDCCGILRINPEADRRFFYSFAYTVGAPVAVPEINGSLLARLALVLGTAYLSLIAVRWRRNVDRSALN